MQNRFVIELHSRPHCPIARPSAGVNRLRLEGCAELRCPSMEADARRWPTWKLGYFALMGTLGLVALCAVVLGLVFVFGGGGPL